MTNLPEPNQPIDMQVLARIVESNAKAIEAVTNQQAIDREQARFDREQARLDRAENREDLSELRQLIDSNAKAIEAAGNQQAADRDLSRQSREEMREWSREVREDMRELSGLVRNLYENSQVQEREIRMQAGEIQNLADSIQVLYSRQPPPPT